MGRYRGKILNHEFERLLANHCAPLLCGKKPAILLAEKALPANCEWRLLCQYGFRVLRIRRREANALIFIYQPVLVEAVVSHPIAAETLREMGYPCDGGLREQLAFLRRRFAGAGEFPHEIGFFLGYPPEDVVGFLTGKDNWKLCGQWKVYGDVEHAVALFEEYSRCKQALLDHIKSGNSIFTVISPALAG